MNEKYLEFAKEIAKEAEKIGESKMYNYFETISGTLKKYYNILSDDIPDFLNDYINTKEMQRIGKISCTSGTWCTKIFDYKLSYSNLDHSIAVALIIWNFTKDRKQTLAGLFHDIATPVFKHSIDFLNGDYEKQESTEELTTQIISESEEIMSLLNRDNINLEEVNNYHKYPIADNDTPMLSADRLEYTLSNGLGVRANLWDMDKVKEIYNNIEIQLNEKGIEELGFKDKTQAEEFVKVMSQLSCLYISSETKLAMQFLADIVKKMVDENLLTKEDLYTISEDEIINKIENAPIKDISNSFKLFKNSTKIYEADTEIKDKYCVSIKAKNRYILPLVRKNNTYIRINEVSTQAKDDIDNFLNYKTKKYAYLDFNI